MATSGSRKALALLLGVTLTVCMPCANTLAGERDYLSGGEAAGIGASSLATFFVGYRVRHSDDGDGPRWRDPLPIETSISRWLGGEPKLGKRNFLDDNFGSAISTLIGGGLVLATDLSYPVDDRAHDVLQGQFLYYFGSLANKGLTDMFKGTFRRKRPFVFLAPELAAQREGPVHPEDNRSFYSGHASSAFYAMTFLNKRVRSTMRREMSLSDYHEWRWVPSVVTYGWASVVALSRIQAYRHYLSDVAVGAIAGTLVATLFYSFDDDLEPPDDPTVGTTPMMFRVSFSF